MADYATLKVPELKKLLQERGLTTGGNKADLITRLKEHDGPDAAGDATTATAAAPAPAATAAAPGKTPHRDDEVKDDADEAVGRGHGRDSAVCAPAHDGDTLLANDVPKDATADTPATAEDEIDYSDDEVKIKTSRSTQPAAAPAATPAAASTVSPVTEQTPVPAADEPAAAPSETAAEAPVPEAPKESFALNLPTTQADEEARRRAERAKRFGTDATQEDDTKKRADRAARFGLGDNAVAGLDSALPESRPPKRGRAQGRDDSERAAKRQSTDRNGAGRHGGGGRGGRHSGRNSNQGPSKSNANQGSRRNAAVVADPEEKRKADERKKRFAAAS